jgi:hypothetical protein
LDGWFRPQYRNYDIGQPTLYSPIFRGGKQPVKQFTARTSSRGAGLRQRSEAEFNAVFEG